MMGAKERTAAIEDRSIGLGIVTRGGRRHRTGSRTGAGLLRHAAWMLLGCCAVGGCMDSTSSLLAKYRSATCIPFSRGPGHERHWEMTIPLRDGSKAVVGAAAWAGGMAVVTYPPAKQEYVAARPGDYIYPVDLRIDPQNDVLYVAATGLAGGVWEQTWLFAFDLKERRQIARRKIRYKDLPADCPSPGTGQ